LLEQHNLTDSTLVIVTSEQGSSFPFAKWTCYDSGLQNALIARWPGNVAPGATSHALIEYVDLVPTFIEAARGTVPASLDGKSYLPVLLGRDNRTQAVCFRIANHAGYHQRVRLLRHPNGPLETVQVHP
jgi:uncharacterized sulfatase